jgi:hypothetical protein
VNARRTALEVQRNEIQQHATIPPEQIEKTVTDYCAEAANNLAGFTEDRWREFLRIIVRAIVFDGRRITIQGQIPVSVSENSPGVELRLEVPLV